MMAELSKGILNMKMMKRIGLIALIFLSTMVSIIINYVTVHDPYTYLWSLLLIPGLLVILSFPSWKITIITVIVFEGIKYGLEIYNYDGSIPHMYLIRLIYGSIIEVMIYSILIFYRTKIDKLFKQLQELTLIDALTGVYNRRYFDIYIDKVIPFSRRTNTPLLLVLFDIDHFKKVNDDYGHNFGDEVLKELAEVVGAIVRKSDGFVRFGGEEFAIIMPETTIETGMTIAERIRKAIEKTEFRYKGKKVPITISLGVTKYDDVTIKELIERADQALYRAKKNGRNQVVSKS